MTFVDQDELIEEEDDRRWRQSCREAMAELEAKWNDDGKTFAWFSKEPDYSVGALSLAGGGSMIRRRHANASTDSA